MHTRIVVRSGYFGVALSLLLGLAACGGGTSSDDNSDTSEQSKSDKDAEPGEIDMTAGGDRSGSYSGNANSSALYHLRDDGKPSLDAETEYCAISISGMDPNSDSGIALKLYYVEQECPSPGTYDVTDTHDRVGGRTEGEFTVILQYAPSVSGKTPKTEAYEPGTGTVEITSNANGEIKGSVQLQTNKAVNAQGNSTATMTLDGTFRAESRF